MKSVALVSIKGGVGKSTIPIYLADSLSKMNKKILLIDADDQGSLTRSILPEENKKNYELADILQKKVNLSDAIIKVNQIKNVFLIQTISKNTNLQEFAETKIQRKMEIFKILNQALKDDFDYVIYDTRGSLTSFEISILRSVNSILVVNTATQFSLDSFKKLKQELDEMQEEGGIDALIKAVIINKVDERKKMHKEIIKLIKKNYDNLNICTIQQWQDIETAQSNNLLAYDLKTKDKKKSNDIKNSFYKIANILISKE